VNLTVAVRMHESQIREVLRATLVLWHDMVRMESLSIVHIPPDLVVAGVTAQRKPPEVRICRLRNQSAVGTRPPSTSTPQWPLCWARR
jgi:hypothetical protein